MELGLIDPDASWSWDSDLNAYFYGHTLYIPSCHNEQYQTDLPLHIRFFDARRHDSASGIVALAEFRKINHYLQIKNLCLDSAHDNYPTYELCKKWNIAPFIDLNSNRGRPESIPKRLDIDTDGTPLCAAFILNLYSIVSETTLKGTFTRSRDVLQGSQTNPVAPSALMLIFLAFAGKLIIVE